MILFRDQFLENIFSSRRDTMIDVTKMSQRCHRDLHRCNAKMSQGCQTHVITDIHRDFKVVSQRFHRGVA